MDNAESGLPIAVRAARMGIGLRDLAQRAGVSRGALKRAIDGEVVRDSTLGMIEATLDRLEHEMSMDVEPDPETVSTLELPDGTKVTFSGSPAGVAQAASDFLARLRGTTPE